MIDEMKIGVSLTLGGDAVEKLAKFQTSVGKSATATEKLNKFLDSTAIVLGTISKRLETLNPQLDFFLEKVEKSGLAFKDLNAGIRSSRTAMASFGNNVSTTATKMANATRSVQLLKDEIVGLGHASEAAGLASGVPGGGGGKGGGRHRGFLHAKGFHAGPFSLSGMAFGAPGIAAMGVGYLGIKGFEANRDYQQELLQLTLQNLPGGTAQAANTWIGTQNNPLVSKVALATALTDAAVITKDMGAAEAIAPQLAQMRAVSAGTLGSKFNTTQQQAAIKAAELITGSKNQKLLSQALGTMFQIGTGTGGRVMPSDFLAMIRASRGALSGSEQYGYETDLNELFALESLVQESGGPQTGRQLAQMRNHILAGRMTTASVKDFQALGLVKPGQAEFNKMGMIKRVKPGGIVGSENPNMFDWVEKTYLPALTKAGITNWDDIRKHILIDFTNTDSTLVTSIISQLNKINSNIPINKGAATLPQAQAALMKTPGGQQMTLGTAWTNFALAIGVFSAPATSKGIVYLTTFLQQLTLVLDSINKGSPFSWGSVGASAKQAAKTPWTTGDSHRVMTGSSPDGSHWYNHPARSFWQDIHGGTANNPTSAGSSASNGNTQVIITLDGRTLGNGIIPYLGQNMNRQQFAGMTRFNTGPSPTPPSTNITIG